MQYCSLSCCVSVCIQAVRGLLDNPSEPVNELSYFDCIESVMENSKVQAYKITECTMYTNCQIFYMVGS